MSLLNSLVSFIEGEESEFWSLIEHQKVKKVLKRNSYKTIQAYKLSYHEIEDFNHEVIVSLYSRLRTYEVDGALPEDYSTNAFIRFISFFLIGESERIALITKGLMTRDARGCSSVNGLKLNFFNHEINESSKYFQTKRSIDENIDLARLNDVRRIIFKYFVSCNKLLLYKAFSLHFGDGLSWNEIARRFNINSTAKSRLHIELNREVLKIQRFLYAYTDLDLSITSLGIYTSDITVCLCMNNPNESKINFWTKDYRDHKDLNTIEGKVGDWIREHRPNFITLNSPSLENKAKAIIDRLLVKKPILKDECNLDEILPLIPNFDELEVKKGFDFVQRCAFILSSFKLVELNIIRNMSSEN